MRLFNYGTPKHAHEHGNGAEPHAGRLKTRPPALYAITGLRCMMATKAAMRFSVGGCVRNMPVMPSLTFWLSGCTMNIWLAAGHWCAIAALNQLTARRVCGGH